MSTWRRMLVPVGLSLLFLLPAGCRTLVQDVDEDYAGAVRCRNQARSVTHDNVEERMQQFGYTEQEARAAIDLVEADRGNLLQVQGFVWAACLEREVGYTCDPPVADLDDPPETCTSPDGDVADNPHT